MLLDSLAASPFFDILWQLLVSVVSVGPTSEFLKKYCLIVLNIFGLKKYYQYQYQYLLVKVWAIPVSIQKMYCQYFIAHTFFIPY